MKSRLSTTQRYTFGRTERLKSRKQIQSVFSRGRHFSHFPFKVYWLPENAQAELQAGVGVSNRHFGRAVDRNRIKRLMREAWRINKISLQRNLVDKNRRLSVFIIYTGNDLPVMENVSAKMKTLADRLQSLSDALDQSPA